MIKKIMIGSRVIGPHEPVFIIAEAGVNHNGNLDLAKKLIDVAAEAGADAIKFQTFKAELLVTQTAPQAEYQTINTGVEESQFEMLRRLELPREWHAELQAWAANKNILFLSTPFSEEDADFLESLSVPAFKIPSGEITNLPYLAHIAKKQKPLLVSTGMSTMEEVQLAVQTILNEGNSKIIVLHSTSNYPPSLNSLNLRAINTLREALSEYQIPIGYSDNGTSGTAADIMAVALGAPLIEKHFTLDKNLSGPDHKASLDPRELADLVRDIRTAEIMLGSGEKKPAPEEESIAKVARKSVTTKNFITKGALIKMEDLMIRRPGTGLSAAFLPEIVGARATRDIEVNSVLSSEDYE